MGICIACAERERGRGSKYCRPCHAAQMREWRKSHPLNDEQKRRDSARSYLSVYIKRGYVKRLPCEVCGSEPSEGHHHDYSKPLDVRWLCREHHMATHTAVKQSV